MVNSRRRIVVRGGGEMGSGVAWRLVRSGFEVIITETEAPCAVRRWVCFSEAVYDGRQEIESISATRAASQEECETILADRSIPVMVFPDSEELVSLRPDVIVDATLVKTDTQLLQGLAPLTIGLGPGFEAGQNVDCVIETNRGPALGRCLWTGHAQPNTGVPGSLGGETIKRVLRSPTSGMLTAERQIGDLVRCGDFIARVNGVGVVSQLNGVLRGLIRPGIEVRMGQKIGDVDPRGDVELCRRISEKPLAIAGGVLEAVLTPRA